MARYLLTLVGVVLVAGSAFGFDLSDLKPSVGGGLGYTFESATLSAANSGNTVTGSASRSQLSAQFFADFTYFEFGLAYSQDISSVSGSSTLNYDGTAYSGSSNQWANNKDLNFKLVGKYPFDFGKFSLYPLAGFEYRWNLYALDKYSENSSQLAQDNDFFLDAGLGFDYPVSDRLYLRAEGIFGWDLTPQKDVYLGGTKYSANGGTDYRINALVSVGYKL